MLRRISAVRWKNKPPFDGTISQQYLCQTYQNRLMCVEIMCHISVVFWGTVYVMWQLIWRCYCTQGRRAGSSNDTEGKLFMVNMDSSQPRAEQLFIEASDIKLTEPYGMSYWIDHAGTRTCFTNWQLHYYGFAESSSQLISCTMTSFATGLDKKLSCRNRRMTFKIIQGLWYWCYSIGHM